MPTFDHAAILRGAGPMIQEVLDRLPGQLKAYLAVYQGITGESERIISINAQGDSSLLSLWRRGKRGMSAEKYDALVDYMDRVLLERSGVPKDQLAAWVNAEAAKLNPKKRYRPPLGRPRKPKDIAHGETQGQQEQAQRSGRKSGKPAQDGGHKRQRGAGVEPPAKDRRSRKKEG
jgi:hypothetical protein